MKRRVIKSAGEFATMKCGSSLVAVSATASRVMTTARNLEIEKAAKSGNWSEMIAKAQLQMSRAHAMAA
jgi:hypothetical protein